MPAGQAATGNGYAIAYAYSGTHPLRSSRRRVFDTSGVAAGVWRTRWIPVAVPAGAASVSVRLSVHKDTAGGSFDVLADAVELRTGLLFVDGFESGTTAQWSAAFPYARRGSGRLRRLVRTDARAASRSISPAGLH